MKTTDKDRSHDLEESPPEVPSGVIVDFAAKHDVQDESPREIPKRFSFVSDEILEMVKEELKKFGGL